MYLSIYRIYNNKTSNLLNYIFQESFTIKIKVGKQLINREGNLVHKQPTIRIFFYFIFDRSGSSLSIRTTRTSILSHVTSSEGMSLRYERPSIPPYSTVLSEGSLPV